MTPLHTAALVAVLAAGAAASMVMAVRPRRRTLAEVRALLHPAGQFDGAGPGTSSVLRPLAARIERSLGDGLGLVGMTPVEVAGRIAAGAVVGTFFAMLLVAFTTTTGLLPFSPLWLVSALGIGAAAGWIMWSDVAGRVDRRRRELRRTTNDFIQLVAVGLTTDQSVDEAIRFALDVGDGAGFTILRDELATAPMRGVPLWEALDELGRRYGERELGEFGASIERQGTQGVSITDTVNSLAASMRAKALDDLERDADRANANLSGPTIGFVVTMLVFLAYPLAVRIGDAFGG